MADIQIPPVIKFGHDLLGEVASVVRRLGCTRPLVVTDPFMVRQAPFGKLVAHLADAGLVETSVFFDTVADPTSDVIDAGVKIFKDGGHDGLISLGGGSPIDTSKAIGMLVANGGHCRDYKVPNPIPSTGPPHVAIPTTAGTGSEVTRFTVVIDSQRGEKMLIAGGSLLPSAAIVDFELSMTMPRRLTADTGVDSLTQTDSRTPLRSRR
jgi:alcohol dehydrogenase class IV